MNMRLILPAVLLLSTPVFAQGGPPPAGGPGHFGAPGHDRGGDRHEMFGEHGLWWKSPEIIARIGLTPDQQKKIEDIFTQSRLQLIDLHATLEKEEVLLQPLMDANPVDQSRAAAQIDKIADTRAALEKTNAKMLLTVRSVLTPAQWTKLRAEHAEHKEMRREGGPGGPGPRGAQGPGPRGPHPSKGEGKGDDSVLPPPPPAAE